MSTEEQRRRRRERYARKKEWKATLEKWVEFAAAMVQLKREEREQEGQSEER
jgi:hypothetical protein